MCEVRGEKVIAREEMYIIVRAVKFTEKETNKPYDCISFRYKSFDFREFHLGEVLARAGVQGFYFKGEDTKEIDNKIFDYIYKKEYYMINNEIEFYNKSRIKLPTIYYLENEIKVKCDCIVTMYKSGFGSIALIKENVLKDIPFDENGFYSEYDYYKNGRQYIKNREFGYLFYVFLHHLYTDLSIIDMRPKIEFSFIKTNAAYKNKNDFLAIVKGLGILNNQYIENDNIKNNFINLEKESWNSVYFNGESLFFLYEDLLDYSYFIEYYCVIHYYLMEKVRIIHYIDRLNNSDGFDEEVFVECINNKSLNNHYNFAWSIHPCMVDKIEEVMRVDKLYKELLDLYQFYKIKYEIEDRKCKELQLKKEKEKESKLLLISTLTSCFVSTEIIEILYNLEMPPLIFFPKNISKILFIVIIVAFFCFKFIKNNDDEKSD